MSGSADVVEMLIGSGASVHCRDGDGIMPLDHAASAGDQRIMLKLLAAGAELTAVAKARIHNLIWSYVQKGIHLDDVWKSIRGRYHSLTHSLTQSSNHYLTHTLSYSLTFTHSF